MGNSTGLIVPIALLKEIGVTTGAAMEVTLEEGRLIAVPVKTSPRAGWAEAAAAVADDPIDEGWLGFGNEGDADLRW